MAPPNTINAKLKIQSGRRDRSALTRFGPAYPPTSGTICPPPTRDMGEPRPRPPPIWRVALVGVPSISDMRPTARPLMFTEVPPSVALACPPEAPSDPPSCIIDASLAAPSTAIGGGGVWIVAVTVLVLGLMVNGCGGEAPAGTGGDVSSNGATGHQCEITDPDLTLISQKRIGCKLPVKS